MTELWRGFANMAATAGREVVIAKGRGSTVWDDKGKAYLDSTASLWYMNVGYGRDEIADAVAAQLKQLAAFHTFGPFANPPLLRLADKVAALSAMEGAAVFFTSGGGSDAVDTAAKLARRYWSAIGRPEKQIILSREHGYHGVNGFGTSLQGIPGNRAG
jgi:putrescine aminotransferase